MNKLIFILVFISTSVFHMDAKAQNTKNAQALQLGAMSFNVRNSNASIKDGINGWPNRKDWVQDMFHYYRPGIIGMQEVLHDQLIELQEMLPEYGYIGVGRNDAKTEGEYSPVFYNQAQYELLQSATFWLSETPTKPSISWGAATYRIVTWGKFRDKTTDRIFFIFNTHFDNREIARNKSADLIVERVHEIAEESPAVVMGDFNSNPKTQAYLNLTDETEKKKVFYDAGRYAKNSYGPEGTFHGFGSVPFDKRERIDFIFTTTKTGVSQYVNISEQRGEVFISDHNPIMA